MAMQTFAMHSASRDDCLIALFGNCGGSVLNHMRENSAVCPVPGSAEDGSWAVRNGVISPLRLKITENGFEDADPNDGLPISGNTHQPRIVTQLDFRNNRTSKTFVVKALCFSHNSKYTRVINPLVSQGHNMTDTPSTMVFKFMLEEPRGASNANCHLMLVDQNNKAFSVKAEIEKSELNKFHVYCMTADYDSEPGKLHVKIYIDGVLRASDSRESFAWSLTMYDNEVVPKLVGLRMAVTGMPMRVDNVLHYALIFDSALSADEIAKFT